MAANTVVIKANDSSFQQELINAGSKLVVVDFTASWCGPCRTIAPVFEALCTEYPQVVFLKVDVDESPRTAESNGVSAMPTFIFFRSKVKIDLLRGADAKALKERVKQHAGQSSGSSEPEEDEDVKGHGDLAPFFQSNGCNCLNESDEHTHVNALKKGDSYLESDCDEQLILTLTFSQAVKIHSLKIKAPSDGRAPKTIKLFSNQPNAVDFDQAERMEGIQKLELSEDDITGDKVIPLRFVKFQNVTNIVIFVANNQGDEETSAINYIKLIGSPLNATNMKDFKRVAGKAGESH